MEISFLNSMPSQMFAASFCLPLSLRDFLHIGDLPAASFLHFI